MNQQTIETSNHSTANPTVRKPKERESGLELFRIISMLLIIAHHYVVDSGITEPMAAHPLTAPSVFLSIFGAWGKIGINCFVLITGFFMCQSKITGRKFLKLILEIEFYRIVIYGIFLLTGYETISVSGLLKALMPVQSVQTLFTSCYLLFFLCIPFLNVLLHHLREKQHLYLLLLTGFIYIVVDALPGMAVSMNYVSWFIVLYFIASYFRLYPKKIFDNARLWGWLTVCMVSLAAISVPCFTWFEIKTGFGGMYYCVVDSNKLPAVLTGVCAFLFFKNWKIPYNHFINTIAASTFGVLLIHANSNTMRQWLWKDVLQNVQMYDSPWIVFHAIGSVLGIYIICTAIDWLRIRWIERPVFAFLDQRTEAFVAGYRSIEHRICTKLHINEE